MSQRTAKGRNSAGFLEKQKGLAKQETQPRLPRQLILAKHMLKLHAALNLGTSNENRAFFCLVLSAWLGVRRIGDFLSSSKERRRVWCKRYRMHRARLKIVNEEDGENGIVVVLKPLKEDPQGWNYQDSSYRTGPAGAAQCGGNTWRALLEGDPSPEGEENDETPVFRNPATGGKYSLEEFKRWVSRSFDAAGLSRFGTATHYFRIGGVATLVAVGGFTVMSSLEGAAMALYNHLERGQRLE